jgi:hypothetical protein
MVWNKDQILQQLRMDNEKAMQLSKILANRLRMENQGYQKDQSHEALVATIILDVATEAIDAVDLKWLASQCGFRVKEMQALMARWTDDGVVACDDGQTIQVCGVERLEEKAIWR